MHLPTLQKSVFWYLAGVRRATFSESKHIMVYIEFKMDPCHVSLFINDPIAVDMAMRWTGLNA